MNKFTGFHFQKLGRREGLPVAPQPNPLPACVGRSTAPIKLPSWRRLRQRSKGAFVESVLILDDDPANLDGTDVGICAWYWKVTMLDTGSGLSPVPSVDNCPSSRFCSEAVGG